MNKNIKSFFCQRNLFVLFFATLIFALNGCGGSGGGGGDSGGNGAGTTPTVITWEKTYGGADEESAYSVQLTSDGGYIIAGNSDNKILVIKIDAYGNPVWQYTQQGIANSIINSGDGGFLIAGQIGIPLGSAGIIKLNSSGTSQWQQTYGNYGSIANEVIQTSDGGYIIVGESSDNAYVIKTDSSGNSIWEKSYGTGQKGIGYSIIQTSDGYIIAGERVLTGRTDSDIWIFKIDSSGNNIIWEKNFGDTGYDTAYSIKLTSDGGFIAAGKKSSVAGDADFWIAKLKSNGDLDWEKTYGSSYDEIAYSIQQTSDGGFILAGETKTSGGDTDFLILKLDANGGVVWEKTYGSSGNDVARSIQQTSDGGYIVAGETTTAAGDTDFWVLKLDANGNLN
ncbi:MAG: hypothetical protein ACPL5I_14645 [Thermodesulfobacteriota bacterium]